MSTPIPPGPPAPIEPAAGRGWGKKVLIGCGVFALIVAACLLALVLYLRQHPETATDFAMKQVETHYAADVTPQERADLQAAYADFRTALKEHRVPREPLERMRSRLMMGGSQNEISREQVRELMAIFRQAAGSGPSRGSSAVPAPSLRPSP